MKNEQEKTEWMQKPVVVWLGAMLCCFLWGSAFPCIKIGYKLWEINSLDTASQILFAGMRFCLRAYWQSCSEVCLSGGF